MNNAADLLRTIVSDWLGAESFKEAEATAEDYNYWRSMNGAAAVVGLGFGSAWYEVVRLSGTSAVLVPEGATGPESVVSRRDAAAEDGDLSFAY